jgi:hypothetical protein
VKPSAILAMGNDDVEFVDACFRDADVFSMKGIG